LEFDTFDLFTYRLYHACSPVTTYTHEVEDERFASGEAGVPYCSLFDSVVDDSVADFG
jgi:hypothetical protein